MSAPLGAGAAEPPFDRLRLLGFLDGHRGGGLGAGLGRPAGGERGDGRGGGGLLLGQDPHEAFGGFARFLGRAEGFFERLAFAAFFLKGRLGGVQIALQRLQPFLDFLLAGDLFLQFRAGGGLGFAVPAQRFRRFIAREVCMAELGAEIADCCLSFGEGAFRELAGGGFRGEGGFNALQAGRERRGLDRLAGGGIRLANIGHLDIAILHEPAPMGGAEAVLHAGLRRLVAAFWFRPGSHASIEAQRAPHLRFGVIHLPGGERRAVGWLFGVQVGKIQPCLDVF